ncbi:MAG: hypothetical protein HOW73_34925 [Polyangiaceae bacterium]|nr:hypothetical protein [Polyangiaceae bacterium]
MSKLTDGVAEGTNPAFRLFGKHRDHPRAVELATKAHALLVRYATEVVSAHRLCPFLRGVDSGLGAVGVVLDVEPDVEVARLAIEALDEPIVHLVFPLFAAGSSPFERFGNRLAETLRRERSASPTPKETLVHASFHPEMVGGRENAYRLIGLLRQSPDPFVQFIPHGLQQGGTVLAGEDAPVRSHAEDRFERLIRDGEAGASEVLSLIAELKREREQAYGDLARLVAASGA